MPHILLAEFIDENRVNIVDRCRAKMMQSTHGAPGRLSYEQGIPLFIDGLISELRHQAVNPVEKRLSANQYGRDLFADGFTVGQLVHAYGGVCQSITDLAVETQANPSTEDFRTLNRCLDDAIAHAVAGYANQQRLANDSEALKIRNMVYILVTGFGALRDGKVGLTGATGDLMQRTLEALSVLVAQPTT